MAYENLKAAIEKVIKTNSNQEITGQVLQDVLKNIVSNLGVNATYAGIAIPTTNPGIPDGPVFYIASEPGNYVNFSNLSTIEADNKIHIIHNDINSNDWLEEALGLEEFVPVLKALILIGSTVVSIGTDNKIEGEDIIQSLAIGKGNIIGNSYCLANGNDNKATGNGSHAEGFGCESSGGNSHAEGNVSKATGMFSHSEGYKCIAEGGNSHAEGDSSQAKGSGSHAEGFSSIAVGDGSHAEGNLSKANGSFSHAEGFSCTSEGTNSHAEGNSTIASGENSHTEGNKSKATSLNSHAEGSGCTASGKNSHAEGDSTTVRGDYSHAEGWSSLATGLASHAEGSSTSATGKYSHAECSGTVASGDYSHAEGDICKATNNCSHAEGSFSSATGYVSHAEGSFCTASGSATHAEGSHTTALGEASHAEGNSTTAEGTNSHAEGISTTASGKNSHAEGSSTVTYGEASHVEGISTTTRGIASHAEGSGCTAGADNSHVGGLNTSIDDTGINSFAHGNGLQVETADTFCIGTYNFYEFSEDLTPRFIIGNGASDEARRNALVMLSDGNTFIKGLGNYEGLNINDNTVPLQEIVQSLNILNLLSNAAIYVAGGLEIAESGIDNTTVIDNPDSIIFDRSLGRFLARKDLTCYAHWNADIPKNIAPPSRYGIEHNTGVFPFNGQLYKFSNLKNNIYVANCSDTGDCSMTKLTI